MVASIHTEIRSARATEIERLATIWYEGWQDAHARILPVALARVPALESFAPRWSRDRTSRHIRRHFCDVALREIADRVGAFAT
jgi:hypothetical protein